MAWCRLRWAPAWIVLLSALASFSAAASEPGFATQGVDSLATGPVPHDGPDTLRLKPSVETSPERGIQVELNRDADNNPGTAEPRASTTNHAPGQRALATTLLLVGGAAIAAGVLAGGAAKGASARVVAFLAPLFSRFHRSDVLGHPTRSRVYEAIAANPGIGFRELRGLLDLSTGVLDHHLRMLHRHELVRGRAQGTHRLYYVAGTPPPPPRLSDTQVRFLDALKGRATAGRDELAGVLGITPQAVGYQARVLASHGLVTSRLEGRRLILAIPSA